MRIGEGMEFLKEMTKNLSMRYKVILPAGYNEAEHYNFCLCCVLVHESIVNIKKLLLVNEKPGWKLRYDFFEAGEMTILNAWLPQSYSENEAIDIESMWKAVLSAVDSFELLNRPFFLVGDLNCRVGVNDQEMLRLESALFNTKCNEDIRRPTCTVNILDFVFANRYAVLHRKTITSILEPSIKMSGLSDHEALLAEISTE